MRWNRPAAGHQLVPEFIELRHRELEFAAFDAHDAGVGEARRTQPGFDLVPSVAGSRQVDYVTVIRHRER